MLARDTALVASQFPSETRAGFIQDDTAMAFSFAAFTIDKPVKTGWSTGAVLGGVVDTHSTIDGKTYAKRLRFVDIWAKRDGRRQLIYSQACPASPDE